VLLREQTEEFARHNTELLREKDELARHNTALESKLAALVCIPSTPKAKGVVV
jgi:hypothetical protein